MIQFVKDLHKDLTHVTIKGAADIYRKALPPVQNQVSLHIHAVWVSTGAGKFSKYSLVLAIEQMVKIWKNTTFKTVTCLAYRKELLKFLLVLPDLLDMMRGKWISPALML